MIDYHRLQVWRKSQSLVLAVYEATSRFPDEERYGLRAQLRRAAVSIASNIAEGAGRNSERELTRFVSFAAGSSSEVECQVELAAGLGFLDIATATELAGRVREIRKMLHGLLLASQQRQKPGPNTES